MSCQLAIPTLAGVPRCPVQKWSAGLVSGQTSASLSCAPQWAVYFGERSTALSNLQPQRSISCSSAWRVSWRVNWRGVKSRTGNSGSGGRAVWGASGVLAQREVGLSAVSQRSHRSPWFGRRVWPLSASGIRGRVDADWNCVRARKGAVGEEREVRRRRKAEKSSRRNRQEKEGSDSKAERGGKMGRKEGRNKGGGGFRTEEFTTGESSKGEGGGPPGGAHSTCSYVQILGTGMDAGDTSPSVLLFFDQRRFLFNCGEGLQRYCIEHKIKLSKIDHLFFTRVCSETVGGLPGLLLTLFNMGEDGSSVKMSIWGPSNLHHVVNAMRTFVPSALLRLSLRNFTENEGVGGEVRSPGLDGKEKTSDATIAFAPSIEEKEKISSWNGDERKVYEDELVQITAVLIQPRRNKEKVAGGKKRRGGLEVVDGVQTAGLQVQSSFNPRALGAALGEHGTHSGNVDIGNEEGLGQCSADVDISLIRGTEAWDLGFEDSLSDVVPAVAIGVSEDLPGERVSQKGITGEVPYVQDATEGRRRVSNFKRKAGDSECTSATPERGNEGSETSGYEEGARLHEASVVYVCELPDVRGKFNPQKAISLGLRPGPLFGRLQRGESVQNPDGEMVHPHQVLGPTTPGPILVLVDCPSERHVEPLVTSAAFTKFFTNVLHVRDDGDLEVEEERFAVGEKKQVVCMVHFGPPRVVGLPQYRTWMTRFGSATQHIMAGHGRWGIPGAPPVLKASARICARLNLLCPSVFPLEGLEGCGDEDDVLVIQEADAGSSAEQRRKDKDSKFTLQHGLGPIARGENLMKFGLRPVSGMGIDDSMVSKSFSVTEVRKELFKEIPEVEQEIERLKLLWNRGSEIENGKAQFKGGTSEMTKEEGKAVADTLGKGGLTKEQAQKVGRLRHGASDLRTDSRGHSPQMESDGDAISRAEVMMSEEGLDGRDRLSCRSVETLKCEDVPKCLQGIGREEMEVVFLGTGSSQPSKYRNVSAVYVHLFNRGGVLLDCGEGTYGQLKRRYGAKRTDEIVAGIHCVWISHIHADHHAGLARILSVRRELLQTDPSFRPAVVIGPKPLRQFLREYCRLEDLGMVFVDCSQTTDEADIMARDGGHALLSWSRADSQETGEEARCVELGRRGQDSLMQSDRNGDTQACREEMSGERRRIGWLVNPNVNRSPRGGSRTRGMQSYWLEGGFGLRDGLDISGREAVRDVIKRLGLCEMRSVPVVHCAHAFGIVLKGRRTNETTMMNEAKEGEKEWKLVYSGDTRPCKSLVDASKGATVLIHEATFDDGMPEEAHAKRHSLTKEAIQTGIAAGVYRTILTHFSQRYPKIPVFDESYTERTCIAFDMMSVNMADLPVLPKLLPSLKLLFRDEMMILDDEVVQQSELHNL